MTVPDIVEADLGDEDAAARVPLGGDDELFVTPTRTLVYRSEGLLSDESVEEYSHNADRLAVKEGRRKSKIQFDYAVDGQRDLAVPSGRLEDALEPVLAGVLNARSVTDADERIEQVYRFSELTLVVTNERLLKHIGSTVWDDEYESYHFDDVTGLTYEEGSVATGIVLTVDGRGQRIKTPNDRFAVVREHLESALFSYHNVSSADELAVDEDEDEESDEADDEEGEVTSFDTGVDPLETGEGDDAGGKTPAEPSPETGDTSPDAGDSGAGERGEANPGGAAASSAAATESEAGDEATSPGDAGDDTAGGVGGADEFSWGVEAAGLPPEVAEHLVEIREAIERQNELIAAQQRTLDRLAEHLDEE